MGQQQAGALALIALGILIGAGAGGGALWRLWRGRQHSHEPLWSRLLATLATAGLTVGFIATGVYYFAPSASHLLWLAQVATGGFVAAIAGYVATIAPTLWRTLWAD